MRLIVAGFLAALASSALADSSQPVDMQKLVELVEHSKGDPALTVFRKTGYNTHIEFVVGDATYFIDHAAPRHIPFTKKIDYVLRWEVLAIKIEKRTDAGVETTLIVDQMADGVVDAGYSAVQPPFDYEIVPEKGVFISPIGGCLFHKKLCGPKGKYNEPTWQERYALEAQIIIRVLENKM